MNDQRAAAGAEHLQKAALEVLSAMRAFLDVAEDLVTDDSRIEDLTRIVGSVVQGVTNATGFTVPPFTPGAAPDGDGEAGRGDESGPDVDLRASGVQHIRVS